MNTINISVVLDGDNPSLLSNVKIGDDFLKGTNLDELIVRSRNKLISDGVPENEIEITISFNLVQMIVNNSINGYKVNLINKIDSLFRSISEVDSIMGVDKEKINIAKNVMDKIKYLMNDEN